MSIFELDGQGGKTIIVYDDKIEIVRKLSLLRLLVFDIVHLFSYLMGPRRESIPIENIEEINFRRSTKTSSKMGWISLKIGGDEKSKNIVVDILDIGEKQELFAKAEEIVNWFEAKISNTRNAQ